jgi:pyrroline-5-carboxylate reductase
VLEKQRIAVIGCGNMGGALVRGFCRSRKFRPAQITLYDEQSDKVEVLAKELGVNSAATLAEAVNNADIIIIAVKPRAVPVVLPEIVKALAQSATQPLCISIAAGVSYLQLHSMIGDKARIVRVMPNVSCLVNQGVTAIYAEGAQEKAIAQDLFATVGRTELVSNEGDMDCITAVSGCGPAFVCVIIEALADGAVKMGLAREAAIRLAAQTVCGAGALVLDLGLHPAQVKDMVTTPGGGTVAGLHVLEKGSLRDTLITAVEASTQRIREQLQKQ